MVWVQGLESPRMAASPSQKSLADTAPSPCFSPAQTVSGSRLPREGPCPPSEVDVVKRGPAAGILSSFTHKFEFADDIETGAQRSPSNPSLRSPSSVKRSNSGSSLQNRPAWKLAPSPPPWNSFSKSAGSTTPEGIRRSNKKRESLSNSQTRLDAQREADQQNLAGKVEQRKQWREDRFQRVVSEVTASRGDVAKIMLEQRGRELADERRRHEHHAEWEQCVYEPLQAQVEDKLSPAGRCRRPCGDVSKTVGFYQPGERMQVRTSRMKDPTWSPIAQHEEEEAFDREAAAVLGWSSSTSPCFPRRYQGGMPRAASRPVLDPTEWGQLKHQALPCGRFAQVCEEGPGARMGKRGGFAPDESDSVPSAGKQTIRVGPRTVAHHDTGFLRYNVPFADPGTQGEAARYKTWHGTSSAAPMQDHYAFARDAATTDMEFPLGKKQFARWP